ncbi:superoxide dismutase [Pseudaquidulcibacter saccharophilus]|uniref:superoxide dismutase n=1 Tax=Pseudaquidulcibacter saccharophilus TaxID=2831900 RepID=UPI001EFF28AB|nr:superoxide dismutase [Pseudaquidulcibacter saccharophilus]
MAFELPALPYADDALEPHYSANTFSYHHKKHHNTYVVNLNNLIKDTEFEGKTLVEIILASAGKNPGVFNNSAQVWNHTFFWNSMSPNGGGAPTGAIADKIAADFGSYDNFVTEFKNAGATQFGSGWAWLVLGTDGKLKVTKTPNAETPLTAGEKPIITCDVWEHAYYLDYQNLRPKFLEVFLEKLVNWEFANEMLAGKEFSGDK